MDALRWFLLLLGAIILIAIYWYGKRAEARRAARDGERDEPYFHPESAPVDDEPVAPEDEWDILPIARSSGMLGRTSKPEPTVDHTEVPAEPAMDTTPAEPPPTVPVARPATPRTAPHPKPQPEEAEESGEDFEVILIVHVVAAADAPLDGPSLADAFAELDLDLDERGVFIRADELGGAPQFGVVNMVKPGVFAEDALASLETPGISLFLTLPGPDSPMVAFRAMSDCARRLAERFDARLEDETHSTLSTQTLTHMEERVREFIQHRARTARSTR